MAEWQAVWDCVLGEASCARVATVEQFCGERSSVEVFKVLSGGEWWLGYGWRAVDWLRVDKFNAESWWLGLQVGTLGIFDWWNLQEWVALIQLEFGRWDLGDISGMMEILTVRKLLCHWEWLCCYEWDRSSHSWLILVLMVLVPQRLWMRCRIKLINRVLKLSTAQVSIIVHSWILMATWPFSNFLIMDQLLRVIIYLPCHDHI